MEEHGGVVAEIDEAQLQEFTRYGGKYQRALKLATTKSVKLHRFQPSGREIWTVVGREGDQLVDDTQPYCSCSHFHFRVIDGKDETCYHLLGLQMAKKLENYDEIRLADDEYITLLKHLVKDITGPKERPSASAVQNA